MYIATVPYKISFALALKYIYYTDFFCFFHHKVPFFLYICVEGLVYLFESKE